MVRKHNRPSVHKHLKQAKESFRNATVLLEEARELDSRGKTKGAEIARSLAGVCQRVGQRALELAEEKHGVDENGRKKD